MIAWPTHKHFHYCFEVQVNRYQFPSSYSLEGWCDRPQVDPDGNFPADNPPVPLCYVRQSTYCNSKYHIGYIDFLLYCAQTMSWPRRLYRSEYAERRIHKFQLKPAMLYRFRPRNAVLLLPLQKVR